MRITSKSGRRSEAEAASRLEAVWVPSRAHFRPVSVPLRARFGHKWNQNGPNSRQKQAQLKTETGPIRDQNWPNAGTKWARLVTKMGPTETGPTRACNGFNSGPKRLLVSGLNWLPVSMLLPLPIFFGTCLLFSSLQVENVQPFITDRNFLPSAHPFQRTV